MPTLDSTRHGNQLAFIASQQGLEIGHPSASPLPPAKLAQLDANSSSIQAVIESGLTAQVFKLHLGGTDYALKKARPACLVQNLDGQTSFLNELQRRGEIAALQKKQGGFRGITPALYGSWLDGILLSPWLDGSTPTAWDERQLLQLFDSGSELIRHGFFEWDYSAGNMIDDGSQLWLFDFGYMYRFDPLRQFNTASQGDDAPQYHLAERFETRNYFAHLLTLEQTDGQDSALAAFRLEKEIAYEAYRRLRADLSSMGATADVLGWLDSITKHWRQRLQSGFEALFWEEGWRSHSLDLDDDLRGQTCTPRTLERCDWMLNALRHQFDALLGSNALQHESGASTRKSLISRYEAFRKQAEGFQITGALPR
ncbi:protein kinase family protein [Chitinimonas naiadis]